MGIRVSNMQKDERTFDFSFAGESAEVTYRPSTVTPEKLNELRDVPPELGDAVLVNMLSAILVRWDVVDDEGICGQPGAMWPTDEASLNKLPLQFLGEVLTGIQNDVTSPRSEGKASPAG